MNSDDNRNAAQRCVAVTYFRLAVLFFLGRGRRAGLEVEERGVEIPRDVPGGLGVPKSQRLWGCPRALAPCPS